MLRSSSLHQFTSRGFLWTIAVLLIATVQTANSAEIAPYNVIRTAKDYEVRVYPAQKWIKTQMHHSSSDNSLEVSLIMFGKLFNYLSRQNDKRANIPMATPVVVLVEPIVGRNDKGKDGKVTMSFYLPVEFQNDTPKPNDPEVSIELRPEFKVFARTFGGFNDQEMTIREHDELLKSLSQEDRKLVNPSGPYFAVAYDPPFKLLNRRNEIWLPINQ